MQPLIPSAPDLSYWDASPALQRLLSRRLSAADREWAEPRLRELGSLAAEVVAPLAAIADRESPRLLTHDAAGNRIDRIDYHPAYRQMESIAYGSGMVAMKYEKSRPESFHTVGFALGYLFAMAEMGLYCPLCMTDGVARIVSRHGSPEQIERVVPRMGAREAGERWTGAMFVTERAGGSDVGSNETIATRTADGGWALTGQKWFCSNVDAQAVLVTARPEGGEEGTKGLRTFLLLPRESGGFTIDRIKDKLGVRSMPTGEVTLSGARAEEVGSFAAMLEMMNLSRLYNAVASVAVMGRALHEAKWYAERRKAFGAAVADHALAAETLAILEAEHTAALHLTFDAIRALEQADAGDAEAARELRILIPVVKAITGKLAVPAVSEAMELIGGNGYIEESPLPRLLRDAQVLPIWEGTTNILVLDAMRVARKSGAQQILIERIRKVFPAEAKSLEESLASLQEKDARRWIDRLARLYELTLLTEAGEQKSVEVLRGRPIGLAPGAGAD